MIPKPRTQDPLDEAFWAYCSQRELRFQCCDDCGAWRFLPRYMCAQCGSPDYTWAEVCGRGAIYTWTVIHQAMHPAFAADVPYVAAVVELEEGVRLATRLVGCEPDDLRLGKPVRLVFRDLGEGVIAPWFEPANAASEV
jgi:uncharacterized protein